MLSLDETAMLLDGLRPPAGMQIAAAVGTTFTLDLTALLAVPVAATLGEDMEEGADLLETIRRYADRTVLFCQAGAISVPLHYRAALTFVEQTVVEIKKPPGGIFHPKVWAVRFEGGGRTLHRVLVMSRNLTFDRAWDVIVRLDEDPHCEQAVEVSGLVDFVRALPGLAARKPSQPQRELITSLTASLSRARLAIPSPFTSGRLVPRMPGRHGQPFADRCDHALAVSPFLTGDAVKEFLATADRWSGVVSRRAALDALAGAMTDVDEVLRVKDAVLSAQESADALLDDTGDVGEAEEKPAMQGLHAKLYVQDIGDTARVWMGSANLTTAAFRTNLEMLIELTGPVHQVGVDAILDPKRERRDLSRLVEDHPLPDAATAVDDLDGVTALEGIAYELASRSFSISLSQFTETWTAELSVTPWEAVEGLTVSARLLSLTDYARVSDGTAAWEGLDLTAITPFVVLELSQAKSTRRVLVRADLIGDPGNRRSAVLAHAIKSREDFLRYLAALLGVTLGGLPAGGDGGFGLGSWIGGARGDRILEDLLTTAARNPERLVTLDETLRQLDAHEGTRDLVPPEFRAVWQAVFAARQSAIR